MTPAASKKAIGSLWIGERLSWMEQASITSFINQGHDYCLYTYGPVEGLPEGATLCDAREVWDSDKIYQYTKAGSPALHADIFRVLMNYKTGRVWADTDIIALRPFDLADGWYIGHERHDRVELGNAIFGVPEGSAMREALYEFMSSPTPVPPWISKKRQGSLEADQASGSIEHFSWGSFGPKALTYFAQKTGEIANAQKQTTFFPVTFQGRKSLVEADKADLLEEMLEREQSLCVHLYSRWMRKICGRNPNQYAPRNSWIGLWCAENGIIEYPPVSTVSTQEKKDKNKEKKEKAPPLYPEAPVFLADLDERRKNLPGGANLSRHGRVTAVTMAKDEGPYVLEWAAYHHLLGFTDLLVYTNDCTDGTDEMLDALASIGLLTRYDNPPLKTKPPQSRALARAQQHPLVTTANWVMVFDFDEFVGINRGKNKVDDLIDLIEEKDALAMSMTWRFFGSSGNALYQPEPVTERFMKAANNNFAKGFGVKTLFKMSEPMKLAIHRPHVTRKARKHGEKIPMNWINGSGGPIDGRVMTWRQTKQVVGYEFAQVNHYGVKSGEEYLMRRLRGDVLNNHGKYDEAYFRTFDRNEETDTITVKMQDDLRALIDQLMQVPQVAAAARLIEERYAAKLDKLRSSEGYSEQMQALGFVPAG